MTTDYTYPTQFDWTAQVDNLADAVKLLSKTAQEQGFREAEEEAKNIIRAMARLREIWCPSERTLPPRLSRR